MTGPWPILLYILYSGKQQWATPQMDKGKTKVAVPDKAKVPDKPPKPELSEYSSRSSGTLYKLMKKKEEDAEWRTYKEGKKLYEARAEHAKEEISSAPTSVSGDYPERSAEHSGTSSDSGSEVTSRRREDVRDDSD